MSWIRPEDKMPPEGLCVLVEVSGYGTGDKGERIVADHDFFLASWIHPVGEEYGSWFLETTSDYWNPTIHAWMPLPRHYQQKEMGYEPEEDMMEHAMFEDDPEWLYKGEAVYEKMTLEELFKL
jgi:hypothetical protein